MIALDTKNFWQETYERSVKNNIISVLIEALPDMDKEKITDYVYNEKEKPLYTFPYLNKHKSMVDFLFETLLGYEKESFIENEKEIYKHLNLIESGVSFTPHWRDAGRTIKLT